LGPGGGFKEDLVTTGEAAAIGWIRLVHFRFSTATSVQEGAWYDAQFLGREVFSEKVLAKSMPSSLSTGVKSITVFA
jgi:hypothetical protein